MTDASEEHERPGVPGEGEPDVLRWPGGEQPTEAAAQVDLDVPHATAPLERELTAGDLGTRRRRVVLPVLLFLATCASTFLAGALAWNPGLYLANNSVGPAIAANWLQGLVYMAAVVGILLTHEMGHFL